MKIINKHLTAVLVLIIIHFFCNITVCNACPPPDPDVVIYDWIKYTPVGEYVDIYADIASGSPEIDEWEWYFYGGSYGDHYDYSTYSHAYVTADAPGEYYVYAYGFVYDNGNEYYDYDYGIVYVYRPICYPEPVINSADLQYKAEGEYVSFDGSGSYDTDPPPADTNIVSWKWYVSKWNGSDYEYQNQYVTSESTWGKAFDAGIYEIALQVKDDDCGPLGYWSQNYDYCYVAVIDTGLTIDGSSYIAVDGERRRIYPALEPPPGTGMNGYAKIEIISGSDHAQIYTAQTGGESFTSKTWNLWNSSDCEQLQGYIDDGLYVQGTSPCSSVNEVVIKFSYRYLPWDQYIIQSSLVNFTVVKVESVTLNPSAIAANGSATSNASATTIPSGRPVTWSIQGSSLGCSINSSTGVVTAGTTGGTITVRATDSSVSGAYKDATLTLVKVNSVTLTPATIAANGSATSTATTSTTPSGRTVTWSIYGSALGCTINSSTGVVTAGTTGGTITVRATDSTGAYNSSTLTLVTVNTVTLSPAVITANGTATSNASATTTPTGRSVAWSIQGSPLGCTINSSTGVVTAGTTGGTIIVRATDSVVSGAYKDATLIIVDVTLTKCSSSFIPMGGSEDNTTTFTATISPSGQTGTIQFTLYDVSDEPGYCMNKPSTVPGSGEDSDSWKDLQFPSQTGFAISGPWASTMDYVNSATVTVKSYDYGAYGKIEAKVYIGGIWHTAHIESGTDLFAKIPRDDNNNHIADSWSGDTGPGSYNGGDDDYDDNPTGNGTAGDRITRYEEYRGFIVNGVHTRTDPTKKDVFYCDFGSIGHQDDLTEANLGAPIHKILADEMNASRSVTPNRATYSGPDQRAIKQQNDYPEALRYCLWGHSYISIPYYVDECYVYTDNLKGGIYSGTYLNQAIDASVTTIYLDAPTIFCPSSWNTKGKFKIENETITYDNWDWDQLNYAVKLWNVTRGVGSTPAAHAQGTFVGYFYDTDDVITFTVAHEAGHTMNMGEDNTVPNNSQMTQFYPGKTNDIDSDPPFNHSYRHSGSVGGSTQEFTVK